MSGVSGLNASQRAKAKDRAAEAARLGLRKGKSRMRYTQGPQRWDGIANGRFASKGDFPRFADCSSFATWCLYQALRPGILGDDAPGDVVNGARWSAGYTGTMLRHGRSVVHRGNVEKGDCVIYGRAGSVGAHTAICVGGGMVISFGSDPGPFLLPIGYRSDIITIRRYI